MKLPKLKAMVKRGESDTLEFKESTKQIERGIETLCAFLNSKDGGTLLFGVTDKQEIVGQSDNDNIRKLIANHLRRIEPAPDIETLFIAVGKEKSVIALIVKPNFQDGPYVCNGKPYIRVQSTTEVMPQEKYKRLLSTQLSRIPWEDSTNNHCTIDDLDKNRIKQVVRIAIAENRLPEDEAHASIDSILRKFNLIVDDKLTNGAVILFCKNEEKQFAQSLLKLARFRGNEKDEFIDQKMIRNHNAFDVFDEAMTFLESFIPVAGRIEEGSPYRIDTPGILTKSLREAIINAIVHRDYSIHGGSISIAVYDSGIEITSVGRLPDDIKVKQLSQKHGSFPRNPHIAGVFYRCKLIEQWGRGTYDMIKHCKEAGFPRPRFEETVGSFTVVLPFKEPIQRAELQPQEAKMLSSLTERQREILFILKQGTLSRDQIMEQLKQAPAVRTFQSDLLKLASLNLIMKSGESGGRFVKWALNQGFNAPSMRRQRAVNAHKPSSKKGPKTK